MWPHTPPAYPPSLPQEGKESLDVDISLHFKLEVKRFRQDFAADCAGRTYKQTAPTNYLGGGPVWLVIFEGAMAGPIPTLRTAARTHPQL